MHCLIFNVNTSEKTSCSTSSAMNPNTIWFLFSLAQLSICTYNLSGRPVGPSSLNLSTRILRSTFMVRFGSWGYWRKSRKPLEPLPWTIAPVKCVLRCHKFTDDLLIFFRCGRLVALWSIPSIIMDITDGSISALSLISWYLALWSLRKEYYEQLACR